VTPDLKALISLSNPQPPPPVTALGDRPAGTLTILNDDSTVSFSQANYSVSQNVVGGGEFLNVVRQGSSRGTATVDFLTTTNGTAILGTNYLSVTNTLTFSQGVSNITVRIPILNDPKMANDATVIMELTNSINTLLTDPRMATLTILTTNAAHGQLFFTQTNYNVSEGGGYASVTIGRTNGHLGVATISFATSDGSATSPYKYGATNGIVTFADGETSKTLNIPIYEESQVEGNTTFYVTLFNPTGGATLIGTNTATVTILDDDIGVHFFGSTQLATNIYVAPENAGHVTLTLERVGLSGVTSVDYATTNFTANAGTNYVAASGTLTFTNGEAIKTFSIALLHDTNVTGDLSFLVTLSNPRPPPAQLFAPSIAEVIVQDVDPGISFSNASFGVFKSATNALISVVRSNANTGIVSVHYSTTNNGTAVAGVDYTSTSGILTFSNGIAFQSFLVPIIPNQSSAGDRTFGVVLSNPSPTNVALLPPSLATVTITNDLSGLGFDAATYTTPENAVSTTVSVLRTGYTNSTVSVDYQTADGSGLAGVNYFPASGTFTFTNGETVKTFLVTNIDDSVVNGDKTVLVQLLNPVGAAVLAQPSAATITIQESDGSLISPAGAALISESGPVNGVIDTNETVTVLFGLRVATGSNTTDLVSTLLATNGVVTANGQSQHYGALVAHGPSASRSFTFTASGTNGQVISPTFLVHDVGGPTNQVVFSFTLGKTTTAFSNSAAITINDNTSATPYPSVINISGLIGLVTKATVTLTNLNHTWPSDIDILLQSPAGSNTYLMAKCGGSTTINNVTLTFDSTTIFNPSLPKSTQITSGTYLPTSYALAPPPFPLPAPSPIPSPTPHYNTNLSVFNGNNPNGAWSLFVFDDTSFNSGAISNGWVLNLTTTGPVPGAGDLALGMTASAASVVASNTVSYTLWVTNFGPSVSSNVVVSDTLPLGATFISASPSKGTASSTSTNGATVVTWSVGTLIINEIQSLTLVAQANLVGTATNSAIVSAFTADPNPDENSASALVSVIAATADLAMTTLVSTPNTIQLPGSGTYTLSVAITNGGPATAPGTIIVVTLPLTVNFVSVSSPVTPFTFTTNLNGAGRIVVTNNVGPLAVGAQASVSIVAQPTAPGSLLNSATCSSAITDPLKANNSLPDVKTVVFAAPARLSGLTAAGANVTLRGSNGVPNYVYYVFAASNMASGWTPIATGYFNSSGSFTLTLTNTPNMPMRFYRIQEP
jgi:uncharacterized repeat protein (TIGR01451 family)